MPVYSHLHPNSTTTSIFHYFVYFCMLAILAFPINSKMLEFMEEQENCAAIQLSNKSDDVKLYENSIVTLEDLEKVRTGSKLENALFFVGGNNTKTLENCVLEICGFSHNGDMPYLYGTCELYNRAENGEPILAPSHIYGKQLDYEVTSLTCACNANYLDNCTNDNCLSTNNSYIWHGSECAIMFQEKHCQSCYFTPIKLETHTQFCRFNTYHIKSMIVRPGCRVVRTTLGDLWWPEEEVLYTNYTGVVDFDKIEAVYYVESSNFTCACPPEIDPSPLNLCPRRPITSPTTPITSSTTTTLTTITTPPFTTTTLPTTTLPTTTLPTTTLPATTLPTTTTSSTTTATTPLIDHKKDGSRTLLIVIFGCVGLIALLVISLLLLRRFCYKRKPTSLVNLQNVPSPSNEILDTNKHNQQFDNQIQTDKTFNPSSPNVDNTGKMQDKNELKSEILEEARKLVGSIFGTVINQDDNVSSLFAHPRTSDKDKNTNDDEFTVLKQQFLQVCSPDHIVCIDALAISKENPLGEGQFGTVHKGYLRSESDGLMELVAIKRMKFHGPKKDSVVQSFLREIKTFNSIGKGNEYIVQFLGACCHTDGLFILTEFCGGGSLKQHLLKEMRPKILPNAFLDLIDSNTEENGYWDTNAEQEWLDRVKPSLNSNYLCQLICWCEQIASGMEYLSSKGIIHVDLAVRNVLLSNENTVKICDFGLSRKCLNTEYYTMSLVSGSFPFSSFVPEVIKKTGNERRKVSLFIDIWAYGCTIWEIFTLGDSLYAHVLEQDIFKIITIRDLLLSGYRHPKPLLAPDFIYQKMLECWSEVPKDRPSFTDLKQFFEKARIELTDRKS